MVCLLAGTDAGHFDSSVLRDDLLLDFEDGLLPGCVLLLRLFDGILGGMLL